MYFYYIIFLLIYVYCIIFLLISLYCITILLIYFEKAWYELTQTSQG
jgi:hypothetical protein